MTGTTARRSRSRQPVETLVGDAHRIHVHKHKATLKVHWVRVDGLPAAGRAGREPARTGDSGDYGWRPPISLTAKILKSLVTWTSTSVPSDFTMCAS